MTSAVDRFVEAHRRLDQMEPFEARRTRTRFVALTLGFAPMLAVGLLPLTVGAGVLAQLVARWTSAGIGVTFLIVLFVGSGAMLAGTAFRSPPDQLPQGWRRDRWAALLTAAIVVAGLVEMISGSRAPDPLLPMWFLSFAWLFVFVPRAMGPWSLVRRTLWVLGPVLATATIIFVWTSGFFSYRFERSVPELDRYVASLAAGTPYRAGVTVGDFEIVARGRLRGCEAAFRIDGWHESDLRWIAWCPDGEPVEDGVEALAGEWYEYAND